MFVPFVCRVQNAGSFDDKFPRDQYTWYTIRGNTIAQIRRALEFIGSQTDDLIQFIHLAGWAS